jgi:tetratricopeptide (TPR) repeat protein
VVATLCAEDIVITGDVLVDRFRLERLLGEGGLGQVFMATDLHTGTAVAIKALIPSLVRDRAAIAELRRDLLVSRLVGHSGVLRAYDLYNSETQCFLVLEHFESQSLDRVVQQSLDGHLTAVNACQVAILIADVVCALHADGVIHSDLKPGNVLVNHKGDIKLIDFGVAHLPMERTEDQSKFVSATIGFAPPEQLQRGAASPSWDIYAFGSSLVALLTGAPPLDPAWSERLVQASADLSPGASTLLSRVLQRCLATNPVDRYHAMVDVRVDLLELLEKIQVPAQKAGQPWLRVGRYAAGVSCLLAAGWWYAARLNQEQMSVTDTPRATQYLGEESLSTDSGIDLQRARELIRLGRRAEAVVLLRDLREREPGSQRIANLLQDSETNVIEIPGVQTLPTPDDGTVQAVGGSAVATPAPAQRPFLERFRDSLQAATETASPNTGGGSQELEERAASPAPAQRERSRDSLQAATETAPPNTGGGSQELEERAASLLAQANAEFEEGRYLNAIRTAQASVDAVATDEARRLLERIQRARQAEANLASNSQLAMSLLTQARTLFAEGRYDEAEQTILLSLEAARTAEAQDLLGRIQQARTAEQTLRAPRP